MPLYDVTGKDFKVDVEYEENTELINALRRRYSSNPQTFKMILRIIDDALNSLKPSISSELVWTKTGALFGKTSNRPLHDVDRLWSRVEGAVGEGKNTLRTMGNLMRWRIAVREETWLVYRQETEEIDPDTGKKISISCYWIDESYEGQDGIRPRTKKEMKGKATPMDLERLLGKFKK